MYKKSTSTAVLSLFAATILLSSAPSHAEANRIVLRVNDRIVTLFDYQKLRQDQLKNIARAGLAEDERQRRTAAVGVETLRTMFEEMLLLSRADQLDIRLAPSQLQEALERTKESFGIRTDEEYDQALRQSGMTRDSLRQQIENSLRIREVFAIEVYSDIVVEEEDLRRYYGTHPEEFTTTAAIQLREVVVLDSSGLSDSDRRKLATDLKTAIEAEEAEKLLAEAESAASTTGWIDLGWVEAGDLDAQLEAAVSGLEPGQVSEPTPARGGFHLLQLVERREARLREFGEVRDALDQAERDRRFQKKLAEYMSELEDRAFIVAHPPPDATGFRVDRLPAGEGQMPALPSAPGGASESG